MSRSIEQERHWIYRDRRQYLALAAVLLALGAWLVFWFDMA